MESTVVGFSKFSLQNFQFNINKNNHSCTKKERGEKALYLLANLIPILNECEIFFVSTKHHKTTNNQRKLDQNLKINVPSAVMKYDDTKRSLVRCTAVKDVKNSFILIWLDSSIKPSKTTLDRLRLVFDHLMFFDNIISSLKYLSTHKNKKIFFIISHTLFVQELVDEIQHLSQIRSIYLLTVELQYHKMWTRSYSKINGVFQNEDNLLCKLAIDLAEFFVEQGDEFNRLGASNLAVESYDYSLQLYGTIEQHLKLKLNSFK
ncbi:unnamed protein product [Didymodactylos carnosus]|uniref:Uncharacterized protein n=1 Tax=Didymodactylos carnosus TaxID=1234261 RepID=A0A816ATP8_9BILA|nr:unnamed protein product [Didymodactylos carnosus]CAF1599944.1 unnamed protein product [Didymodactylos carnosus]CAF4082832.1 unnamed protein product [Didymodactylos carnosus]CAF4476728.1 unnamed protein product [Didymodactylos carnosus]